MLSHSLLTILVMVAVFSIAKGDDDCPWDEAGLVPWSSLNADPNAVVTIDKGVLYDQSSADKYIGINVVDGGKLVFKPDVTDGLNLITHYIIIKNGGRMDVGSRDCRYTGELTIQLIGGRETIDDLEEFGDKVIGVDEGGSLNIWGEKKVSWTRLSKPLFTMDDEAILFDQEVTEEDKLQGLIVYHFDPALSKYTEDDVNREAFKFKGNSEKKFAKAVEALDQYLKNVNDGHIVIAVIRKSLMGKVDTKNFTILTDVIADFLGIEPEESQINQLEFYDGYVMIKKKGDPNLSIEETSKYRTNSVDQVTEGTMFDGNKKYYAKSYARSRNHGKSYTHVQVIDTDLYELIITLSDDITSWDVGSTLLIAPTGNHKEIEFGKIIEKVDNFRVKIDLSARFDHLCETYKGVRMCAEVALIDRNVLVEGVTLGDDQHGGNIKCLKNFTSCNFADFELNLMGSHFPLGRYPIHFHLAEDVTGKAVVDSLSIHNSYARCVVAHFTHNLEVKHTLCFECLGHGFFLEDGGEKGNKFINNLAVAPRRAGLPNKTHLIPTDSKPCGFFATNPDNVFEDNVAVAAEGHGFQFAIPKLPIGLTNKLSLSSLEEGEALQTNIKSFRRNTAHSNVMNGVVIGTTIKEDGKEKWEGTGFAPRVTPTDPTSDLATLELSCINAYNNGETNIYIRAADFSLKDTVVAKGLIGIAARRSIKNEVYEQRIEHSVILGDREKDQPEGDISDDKRRVGLEFTGPIHLSEVYFDDFYQSQNYPSGALGFEGDSNDEITGNVMGEDIFFGFEDPNDGSRVIGADTNRDKKGNLVESFFDANGFVTNSDSPKTVLRNTPFHVTDDCFEKWDTYAVCEEEYAMVDTSRDSTIYRVHGDTTVELPNTDRNTKFNVITNNQQYHYLFRYDASSFGKLVNVRTFDANKGEKFVVGFCVPKGEEVELNIRYSDDLVFSRTDSLNDLSTSTENEYFQDVKIGVAFVNFVGQDKDSNDDQYCVDDYGKNQVCRILTLRVNKAANYAVNDNCIADAVNGYPPLQPAEKRVSEQKKKRKVLLSKTEKRLMDLIQKLDDQQSNYAERIAIPEDGDDVTISTPILLDESPGVDLNSITIGSGGRLVFAPDSDLILRTYYIHIDGGRMDIGSELCRYTGKAKIQLLGNVNDTYSVPGFGRKFIGVDADGILEIHGQNKLPWTKLTSTLEKLPDSAFTSRDTIDKDDKLKGLIVKSYNPTTGVEDRDQGVFRLGSSSQKMVDSVTDLFIEYVDAIPDGNVVSIAVRKFIVDRENALNRSRFYDALETLGYGDVTGTSQIRDLVFYDGFAMILTKGDPSNTVEGFEPYKVGGLHQTSTASYISMEHGLKYFVFSYTRSRGYGKSFVEFEVTHIAKSCPIITVIDDVTSWKTGDRVIITSTDYDWEQVEVGKVMDCDSCLSNQVRIDLAPKFTHYGEIYKNVDMRAEVAVLTRNVIIEGVVENFADEFGGHIKVVKGFKDFHIENAELTHLGQSTSKGNYPIHWHMCEDVRDLATYARGNAIHQSYARCVTVHGTHGVQVMDNVCFDSIGHGFFLEDGGEKWTTIKGNLGAGQLFGDLIPTDNMKPSTYWITNPLTVLENNVAAGGQGNGIWYVFPEEPMGPSNGKGYMQFGEAQHTAVTKFSNNVAHSNRLDGLRFEQRLNQDGTELSNNNNYEPLVDPLDDESENKLVEFSQITAYKNSKRNAVLRGGFIQVKDSSFSDSPIGLTLRRFSPGQSVVNSVIIGDSDNKGEPSEELDRSLPDLEDPDISRRGFVLGAGPILADNIWFDGFTSTASYSTGAVSFSEKPSRYRSPRNIFRNIGFGFDDDSEGNRVIQTMTNISAGLDANKVDIFYDEDGGVTSIPGASVVRPLKFHMTTNCALVDSWKMAVCDESFAQIHIRGTKEKTMTMMRSDDVTNNRMTSDASGSVGAFNVILGDSFTYLVKFNSKLPKVFSLEGVGMQAGDNVVVGVCVPKDVTFKLITNTPGRKVASPVTSLAALKSDTTGQKYFLDDDAGVLFVKIMTTSSFSTTSQRLRNCPDGVCARVGVNMITTKDWSDTDCEAAFKTKYESQVTVRQILRLLKMRDTLQLPSPLTKTSPYPPVTAGAGSTRP